MCQTSISVWFVCKLCQDSFQQVDDFIDHKKEKHFVEFQNTSCIVFEETEFQILCPVITNEDPQLAAEIAEPPIKIELNDEDPILPFSSEIIDEPNLCLVEPKSELVTYEREIIPKSENNHLSFNQPEQNPYVLLKRLTAEEIESASVPQNPCRLLKFERKISANANNLDEPPNSLDVDSSKIDHVAVKKSTEFQKCSTLINIFTGHDLQLQCQLCSKQLKSDAQLKIHVGICALNHKDRNRYCITCNRKLSTRQNLEFHCLRYHGTEDEKASLYKFKCHLCPMRYRLAGVGGLKDHLESHQRNQQHLKAIKSKSFKCLHPNCGKEFTRNQELRRHAPAHSGLRRFSCSNCTKTFSRPDNFKIHMRIHTGERPYKCTVDNCNTTFTRADHRLIHRRTAHRK